MANLSQDHRNFIAKNPLMGNLDHLQEPLQEAEQNLYDGPLTDQDRRRQKAIARLLGALMAHEVAHELPYKIRNQDLYSNMSTLLQDVRADKYKYEHYRPLAQLVLKEAPDVDIWSAVIELITKLSQITPPASIPVSCDGTPIKKSSASFQGSEQTRKIIESAMFYEIKSCTYRNVDGFFEKYFEGKPWSHESKAICDRMKQCGHERWTGFPDPPTENAVSEWLNRFQEEHLSDSHGIYCTNCTTKSLTGGEAPRQLDLAVMKRGMEISGKYDWKDVRVIGELKQSKSKGFKLTLLQLAVYMRDAFAAQPLRRFIHGFLLHGTTMELWVFDRSGPYSSGEFDIHEKPEKFIRAIAGYTMMNYMELGLDIMTKPDGIGRFITISKDETGKKNRLQLDCPPFVKQRAVVCRGTTCFRSSDGANVVKFSWTSDKRPPEASHLRLARKNGVEGIAELIGYQRITSISELRSGLTFPSPYKFKDDTASAVTSASASAVTSASRRLIHHSMHNFGISKTSSKPKHPGDERSSRKSKLSQQDEAAQMPDEPAVSLYKPSKDKYSNRIFGCLVIAPAGRALSEFTRQPQSTKSVSSSIIELLITLRDAIKAHRSLYLKGKILHRDISENNIIITNLGETGGVTGMLIDLDLAKVTGSDPSGARHQTGTMQFMAIEVLDGISHTYRHDLESFFYVLIWLCARRGWDVCEDSTGRPEKSRLTYWYSGDLDDISMAKTAHMLAAGLEKILSEFPEVFGSVKPLCRKIRRLLFPICDERLFVGTPSGPAEELYDGIIEAFTDSISRQESG